MQSQLDHPVITAQYGSGGHGSARASGAMGTLASLVDAHHTERRLLDDLIGIMCRQRSAVAADDLQGVDDSVFATHRILVTLGEARRRRRALNTIVGGSDELDSTALTDAFGGSIPQPLQDAREALRSAAADLAREVDVNRRLLREALANGEEYVRRLLGSADVARADYSSSAGQPVAESRGGILLDRRV